MSDITHRAETQLTEQIQRNPYPGRGLVIGRSDSDEWLQIYWIMGRSEQSQNRRFVVEDGTLRTEARDLSLVVDPSLIIYEAMLELPGRYLVSNGDQTRTLLTTLQAGGTFEDALAQREHEPDAPHYTPRISGMLDFSNSEPQIALSILKANLYDPLLTDRYTYRPAALTPGFGMGLTTYAGDGSPLPSFGGDPLLLPCVGSAEQVLQRYWDALNSDYRIAIAVKTIDRAGTASRLFIQNRWTA